MNAFRLNITELSFHWKGREGRPSVSDCLNDTQTHCCSLRYIYRSDPGATPRTNKKQQLKSAFLMLRNKDRWLKFKTGNLVSPGRFSLVYGIILETDSTDFLHSKPLQILHFQLGDDVRLVLLPDRM